MAFSYRDLFFGGTTFCFCLPVRMGVISMSLLGILVAGVLSIILWFEVSTTVDLTTGERVAFILAGLLETILFAASILGFTGAIVRKQSFVQTYAYILYFHFVANIAVAIYLLVAILQFQSNLTIEACQDTITDPTAQSQCTGLLQLTKTVYVVIASIVLIVELYGAIIVARYLNQVQREKRMARFSRMDVDSAFRSRSPRNNFQYSNVNRWTEQQMPLYNIVRQDEFDPYVEIEEVSRSIGGRIDPRQSETAIHANYLDTNRPPPPIEAGYGGGSWTIQDISEEEKIRLRQENIENGMVPHDVSDLTDDERERRRSEVKSSLGPLPSRGPEEIDVLPQYVAPVLHR